VVNYRNTIFKILEVGFQGQFRGTDSNGVGGSVQLTILPGVKFGGAITRTNWSPTTQGLVRGLGENADYAAVGTRIDWRISNWDLSTLIRKMGTWCRSQSGT
jgi:hypothetical protein